MPPAADAELNQLLRDAGMEGGSGARAGTWVRPEDWGDRREEEMGCYAAMEAYARALDAGYADSLGPGEAKKKAQHISLHRSESLQARLLKKRRYEVIEHYRNSSADTAQRR